MRIVWSEPAKQDYWQNIDYLLLHWNEGVAIDFIQKVDQVLFLISKNPLAFTLVDYKEIRSVLVVSQITLYYRISSDRIELIRFWNNYQNPDNKNLK